MFKKSLIVQTLLLLVGAVLGMFVLAAFSPELKTIHATVGVLIGLVSFISVYLAFREKAPASLLTLVIVAAALVVTAYVGGRLTATSYDLGLNLMRGSAVAALIVSAVGVYWTKNAPTR